MNICISRLRSSLSGDVNRSDVVCQKRERNFIVSTMMDVDICVRYSLVYKLSVDSFLLVSGVQLTDACLSASQVKQRSSPGSFSPLPRQEEFADRSLL